MQNKSDPNYIMPHRRLRLAISNSIRLIVRLLFRLHYEGLEHIPVNGPAILVGNHTSMIDMLVIHTVVHPWISWVAKKELFRNKILGGLFRKVGCIPVDRDKIDLVAAREIFKILHERQVVGIFPQGTRVQTAAIPYVHPRSGAIHFAIKTGVPLLPVAIDGRFRLFGKVRIVFGPMIQTGLDPHGHYQAAELDQLTIGLMQHIYALIGLEYRLAEQNEAASI
jgi:1-acyl-sn-glycerol-3-phosphate acyltransferase